jgi:hypothetical protein
MGYIKKVVDTGVEFADSYKMPEYVAKARGSSKIIDVASEKIEAFYCEKGSPLLQMVDELTAVKINTALDIANSKVEQAQKLKIAAAGKVNEKKSEAIEMKKQIKASIEGKKSEGIKKYQELKIDVSKKVDDTKTIMRKRYMHASEEAVLFGQTLETKLKEKASTNEYADKVLSVVLTAKEQVMIYGDALVKKSLSLPLTLQERMDRAKEFAKETIEMNSIVLKEKFEEKKLAAKKTNMMIQIKMKIIYHHMNSANALDVFRTAFGDNAATKAEDTLKNLKGVYAEQVTPKMKDMYAYSTYQVGHFANFAEKMEEKYFGSTLVFRARARFTGK